MAYFSANEITCGNLNAQTINGEGIPAAIASQNSGSVIVGTGFSNPPVTGSNLIVEEEVLESGTITKIRPAVLTDATVGIEAPDILIRPTAPGRDDGERVALVKYGLNAVAWGASYKQSSGQMSTTRFSFPQDDPLPPFSGMVKTVAFCLSNALPLTVSPNEGLGNSSPFAFCSDLSRDNPIQLSGLLPNDTINITRQGIYLIVINVLAFCDATITNTAFANVQVTSGTPGDTAPEANSNVMKLDFNIDVSNNILQVSGSSIVFCNAGTNLKVYLQLFGTSPADDALTIEFIPMSQVSITTLALTEIIG
jgi:hypothetical protein